ncbi:MAG: hypothetical protein QXW69_07045, partial [Nitrososphaerota archaeon]
EEFENEDLKRVKKERTFVEYAWTCTSNFMLYLLENKDIESLVYLDADLYFFNNPQMVLDEIGDNSLAIVEHRYSKNRKFFEKPMGRFNVSFVYAKNNEDGRRAIKWWADKVIEWCYDRYEDNKFGDQKYLDEFPKLFSYTYIVQHKGVNIAPWNIRFYKLKKENNQIYVDNAPLIFYHFHRFYILDENNYIPASRYYIPSKAIEYIYNEYWQEIKNIIVLVRNIKPEFNYGIKKMNGLNLIIEFSFKCSLFEDFYLLLSKVKHSLKYKKYKK